MNPLLQLARDNKAEALRAAIAVGCPVNEGNAMGQTALHIASLWGSTDSMRALIGAELR